MRPIDTFRFLPNNQISYDEQSLTLCYAPILGQDAISLYSLLVSRFDNGQANHQFTALLNHLQFGMPRLEQALSVLMVLKLIAFYQDKDGYLIRLLPALSKDAFLRHSLYRRLLEHYIGEYAVSELMVRVPETAQEVTKRFSEVFTSHGDLAQMIDLPILSNDAFDMDSFQKRMLSEDLHFANDKEDIIALYHFADKHQLNWIQAYQLAKETAVERRISLERMAQKQNAMVQETKTSSSLWSKQEKIILADAKSLSAKDFLGKLKHLRKARVTGDEQALLLTLAHQGFLDEVINVMVLYTLNKTKSANLNARYLEKLANDFAYQEITTAEMAMEKLRQSKQNDTPKKASKQPKPNLPAWSNEDYQNQTSQDEQKRLEEIKRRALEKVRKEGD